MKIALCFWGIARSTKYTIESINKYIFNALKELGIEYEIFLHTYELNRVYTNIRSHEINCVLDNNDWKLINPDHYMVENQDNVDISLNLIKYRKFGDPWFSNFQTFDNHIRALWSLNQVTSLWIDRSDEFDYIVYLRPDVTYLSPLKIEYFDVHDNQIFLPNFCKYPVNDRFSISKPHIARLYGARFNEAYTYSCVRKLHSETFVNDILLKYGIKPIDIPFQFRRTRANGIMADNDL